MHTNLIALGAGGARIAEAALYACMAGVWPQGSLSLLCTGLPRADEQRLRRLVERYTVIRGLFGAEAPAGFSADILFSRWPEEEGVGNLRAFCSDTEDRMLLRALFTQEELDAEGLRGAGPAVALNWERLLHDAANDSLCRLVDTAAREDGRLLICGSLSESCCAAGVSLLLRWMKARQPAFLPCCCLLLPVDAAEDASLAKAALSQLQADSERLCLLGLPEDCRDEGRQAHLADWLAVYAMTELLAGKQGPLSCRVTLGSIDWAIFGQQASAWREAYTRLTQLSCLWLSEMGPVCASLLDSPSWLKERMTGWFGSFFPRSLSQEDRHRAAQQAESLGELLLNYVEWMMQLQATLPFPLRFSGELAEIRAEAAAHYRTVLELAGQLSQLQYDIKRSGMAEEEIVHRRMTGETEAERARRQLQELREDLISAMGEQDQLNLRLGGRLQRLMIEEAVARCRDEAEGVRSQLKVAREKIDRAEKVASPAQMSAVQAARSQMERLEHHLVALDGRTACARRDLQSSLSLAVRTRAPQAADSGEEEELLADTLFPQALLKALQGLAKAEGRGEEKQLRQQAEAANPWPGLDAVPRSLARPTDAASAQPMGQLLRQLLLACPVAEAAQPAKDDTEPEQKA